MPGARGQAQPYRKGPREPSPILKAMLAGRPSHLPNPQSVKRETQRRARKKRKTVEPGGMAALALTRAAILQQKKRG